jgi:hypothetical protein
VDSSHPYISERGISKETAENFGVGFFSGKGSMNGPIVIPIHNQRGELVANTGRAIWENHFLRIDAQLVMERRDTLRAIVNLPALKASTREEVYRRLLRGRNFLLASLQDPFV